MKGGSVPGGVPNRRRTKRGAKSIPTGLPVKEAKERLAAGKARKGRVLDEVQEKLRQVVEYLADVPPERLFHKRHLEDIFEAVDLLWRQLGPRQRTTPRPEEVPTTESEPKEIKESSDIVGGMDPQPTEHGSYTHGSIESLLSEVEARLIEAEGSPEALAPYVGRLREIALYGDKAANLLRTREEILARRARAEGTGEYHKQKKPPLGRPLSHAEMLLEINLIGGE